MFFAGSTLTSSLPPRQPFKKKASVQEWTPSAASAKSGALKREIFDVEYRTYPDTDTLSVYFAKASSGIICHTGELLPGILVDYTEAERVVCIDIDTSMPELPYHIFDVPDQIDSKPPLALRAEYDATTDKLALSFNITSAAAVAKEIPTEDPDISFGVCSSGLWRAILFKRAHERLLVPAMKWVDKSE